jgi:Holliday junction resolvasome RuvABC endonuclease subunit
MRCLALDASTSIGWVLFDGPAKLVDFGTWQLTKQYDTTITGRRLAECEDWLGDLIERQRPDVVGFEAPILPFYRTDTQSTGDTVRLLVGLATIIDLSCHRHHRRCIEVPVPTAKVRLAGSRHAKKRDMVNAAIRRGWLVEDEHQADACAVALCTFDHCGVGELL